MSEGFDILPLFNRVHELLLSADEAGIRDYKTMFLLAVGALDVIALSDMMHKLHDGSPYIQLLGTLLKAEKQGFTKIEKTLKEDIRKRKEEGDR